MSVKKFKSDPLEEPDAIKFHNDFVTKHPARPTTPTHDFGKAICIKLDDLKDYICEAEKALRTAGVPEDNRGIAMYFMINQHSHAGYRMGKPSIMFVTSAYTEDGNGRVTALSNQIEKVPLTNGEENPFVNLKGDINHVLNFYNFHDRHP
jgi:hypothetical protein